MAVVGRDKQNRVLGEMRMDQRIGALIASPARQAASGSAASQGDSGSELLQVICDPYEWKSAVRFALVIFVGFLALAPALTPDEKKLAAKINHQTLKAAAAIKSSQR